MFLHGCRRCGVWVVWGRAGERGVPWRAGLRSRCSLRRAQGARVRLPVLAWPGRVPVRGHCLYRVVEVPGISSAGQARLRPLAALAEAAVWRRSTRVRSRPCPGAGLGPCAEGCHGRWWRCRESNPGPQMVQLSVYVCSFRVLI